MIDSPWKTRAPFDYRKRLISAGKQRPEVIPGSWLGFGGRREGRRRLSLRPGRVVKLGQLAEGRGGLPRGLVAAVGLGGLERGSAPIPGEAEGLAVRRDGLAGRPHLGRLRLPGVSVNRSPRAGASRSTVSMWTVVPTRVLLPSRSTTRCQYIWLWPKPTFRSHAGTP
jgi:hypothetical protein